MRTHLIMAAAFTLLASPAVAQTAIGTGVGTSEANSASLSAAGAVGNTINIAPAPSATRQELSGTQTIRNAPAMVAPGLTAAGLETCLGSASGGVSAVGFGISGGSTYKDEDCTARLDARTLYAMGLKAASVARLCARPDMWRAMPAECERYWPAGVPLPHGIQPRANIVMSASVGAGTIDVVDGRTGLTRPCSNYRAAQQKCMRWADEAPRKRTAAVTPPKKLQPAPAPKAEPAKVEPAKVEPKPEEKKS